MKKESEKIEKFRGEFGFLSNFFECKGIFIRLSEGGEKIECKSVEHAYQTLKAEKIEEKRWILDALTPGEAKRRGRKVKIRKDWSEKRIEYMYLLLKMKFKNQDLRNKLLKTKDKKIEERNEWGDTFWGIWNNQGVNNLGKLLMKIRKEIK